MFNDEFDVAGVVAFLVFLLVMTIILLIHNNNETNYYLKCLNEVSSKELCEKILK